MKGSLGFELLADQVAEYLLGEWELSELSDPDGYALGDSKIEQLFFAAVQVSAMLHMHEYDDLVRAKTKSEVSRLMAESEEKQSGPRIIVWPQAQIKGRRIDFAFFAREFRLDAKEWRPLLVECDGHNFHERTKEQEARDRAKDRAATLAGYEFLRFTGSEIWRDPMGCAEQVFLWTMKGSW